MRYESLFFMYKKMYVNPDSMSMEEEKKNRIFIHSNYGGKQDD